MSKINLINFFSKTKLCKNNIVNGQIRSLVKTKRVDTNTNLWKNVKWE